MVNTFVIHPDFAQSAKCLDINKSHRRLLKQCVEAQQILNILDQLHHIVDLRGWTPLTKVTKGVHLLSPEAQAKIYLQGVAWVKDVRKRYLDGDVRYKVLTDGTVEEIRKDDVVRMPTSTPYSTNKDGTVIVWLSRVESEKKKWKNLGGILIDDKTKYNYDFSRGYRLRSKYPFLFCRKQLIIPALGEDFYSLGFSQHAIVKMWVGYEDALRAYINAHINEYNSRVSDAGKQCHVSMSLHKVRKQYVMPWWVYKDSPVLLSHRSALLLKEVDRNEEIWYATHSDFVDAIQRWSHGYVWTGSFDEACAFDYVVKMIEKKPIDPSFISAPQRVNKQTVRRLLFDYDGPYTLDKRGFAKIKVK